MRITEPQIRDSLQTVFSAVEGTLTRKQVIEAFLQHTLDTTTANCSTFRILDRDKNVLLHVATRGFAIPALGEPFSVDDPAGSVGAYVFANQNPHYCPDTHAPVGQPAAHFSCTHLPTRSYLCVPVTGLYNRYGVLSAHGLEVNQFNNDDCQATVSFGKLLGVALDLLAKDEQFTETLEVVAHQSLGPLVGILGYCMNFRDGVYGDAEELRAKYELVIDQIQRAIRSSRNMILLSQLISSARPIQLSPCRLMPMLIGVAKTHQGESRANGITIRVDPESLNAVVVPANEELLQQAVGNLIDNAVKYSDGNTRIVVRGVRSTRLFKIEVENKGIGLTGPELSRIFAKGQESRAAAARVRVPHGTGIGLWVAQRIMELHGGKVFGEPTDSQGLTRFYLAFSIGDVRTEESDFAFGRLVHAS